MDDFSIPPVAPTLDFTELPEEPEVDPKDKALADAFYASPVEQLLLEEIDSLNQQTDEKLPADEYKITELSKRKAINALERTLLRIKDAVQTVESIESRKKG